MKGGVQQINPNFQDHPGLMISDNVQWRVSSAWLFFLFFPFFHCLVDIAMKPYLLPNTLLGEARRAFGGLASQLWVPGRAGEQIDTLTVWIGAPCSDWKGGGGGGRLGGPTKNLIS
eukprot:1161339-Pelagomonas_calceolata.AAC.13